MAVKVSGECPKCKHKVSTTAARNRVTWRGDCPVKDCGGKIIARRAPEKPQGDQPPATPPAAPPAPVKKSRVMKVSNDDRSGSSTPASVPPAPDGPAPAGGGAANGPGDGEPHNAGGKPVTPPPAPEPGRRAHRAPAPDSGDTGRRPYAHIYDW